MKRGARLAGGRFRGRRLPATPGVRPTEGRVREALASVWMPRLAGARVLDLYAGTGAVGLELLGRGAASVALVDKAPATLRALRRTVEQLGAEGASVHRLDLPRGAVRLAPARFDLIFADPPYAFEDDRALLAAAGALAAPSAQMVIEHAAARRPDAPPAPWRHLETRRYGEAALSFYTLAGREAEPAGSAGPD